MCQAYWNKRFLKSIRYYYRVNANIMWVSNWKQWPNLGFGAVLCNDHIEAKIFARCYSIGVYGHFDLELWLSSNVILVALVTRVIDRQREIRKVRIHLQCVGHVYLCN